MPWKCKNCGEEFESDDIDNLKCPKCGNEDSFDLVA